MIARYCSCRCSQKASTCSTHGYRSCQQIPLANSWSPCFVDLVTLSLVSSGSDSALTIAFGRLESDGQNSSYFSACLVFEIECCQNSCCYQKPCSEQTGSTYSEPYIWNKSSCSSYTLYLFIVITISSAFGSGHSQVASNFYWFGFSCSSPSWPSNSDSWLPVF